MLGAGLLALTAGEAVFPLALLLQVPPAGRGLLFAAIDAVLVPQRKIPRDIHPRRAGHAVPAAGATVADPPAVDGRRLLHHRPLPLVQGPEGVEGSQVVLHLLQGGHAGEHRHHIGQAGRPAQGPGGRRGPRPGPLEQLHGLRRRVGQSPALHRLHDDQRHAPLLREGIAPQPRLLVGVHVVELELAQIPLPGGQDLFELVVAAVEGKAEPPEQPLPLEVQAPVHHPLVPQQPPPLPVQVVEQIEVQIRPVQPLPLLVKDPPGLVQIVDQHRGQLGGQVVAPPGVLGQRPAHKVLAGPLVVEVSGVEVVDPALDGPVQQAPGLGLVDGLIVQSGEAHAAVAQQGGRRPQRFNVPVFHL